MNLHGVKVLDDSIAQEPVTDFNQVKYVYLEESASERLSGDDPLARSSLIIPSRAKSPRRKIHSSLFTSMGISARWERFRLIKIYSEIKAQLHAYCRGQVSFSAIN